MMSFKSPYLVVHIMALVLYVTPWIPVVNSRDQNDNFQPFFKLKNDQTKRPSLAPGRSRVREVIWSLNWPGKNDYYYTKVSRRIQDIVSSKCHNQISYLTGQWNNESELMKAQSLSQLQLQIPQQLSDELTTPITVMTLPAADNIIKFWKQIKPPTQMRTDIAMCIDTWHHNNPLFIKKSLGSICHEVS